MLVATYDIFDTWCFTYSLRNLGLMYRNKWCPLQWELPLWFLLTWCFSVHCINFFLVNTFDVFWNTSVLSFFNVLCFLLVADIDGNTFWSHPFNSLCHPKQLEEFIVMECSIVRDIKRSAGAGMISKKVSSILFTFP